MPMDSCCGRACSPAKSARRWFNRASLPTASRNCRKALSSLSPKGMASALPKASGGRVRMFRRSISDLCRQTVETQLKGSPAPDLDRDAAHSS